MPAAVYRMAGRPHHTEVIAAAPSPEPVAEVITVSQEKVETVTDEANPGLVQTSEQSTVSDPENASMSYPTWDASWTKAKLLEVATALNLPVTIDNTKAQIIAALTEATSV